MEEQDVSNFSSTYHDANIIVTNDNQQQQLDQEGNAKILLNDEHHASSSNYSIIDGEENKSTCTTSDITTTTTTFSSSELSVDNINNINNNNLNILGIDSSSPTIINSSEQLLQLPLDNINQYNIKLEPYRVSTVIETKVTISTQSEDDHHEEDRFDPMMESPAKQQQEELQQNTASMSPFDLMMAKLESNQKSKVVFKRKNVDLLGESTSSAIQPQASSSTDGGFQNLESISDNFGLNSESPGLNDVLDCKRSNGVLRCSSFSQDAVLDCKNMDEYEDQFQDQDKALEKLSEGLSDEQKRVFNMVKEGKSVCITGLAGAGKSFLMKRIIAMLKLMRKDYAATAATGIAAVHIGGTTLHSYIALADTNCAGIWGKKMDIKVLDTLIIDEISMISAELFELVHFLLTLVCYYSDIKRRFNLSKTDKHNLTESMKQVYSQALPFHLIDGLPLFGGKQLILSGDFMQLTPVPRRNSSDSDNHIDGKDKQFIFQSPLFSKVFNSSNIIVLKQIFRQVDQPEFLEALNEIRMGKVSTKTINFLKALKQNRLMPVNGILPTILYTTNKDVEKENNGHLDNLSGDAHIFETETIDPYRNLPNSTLLYLKRILDSQIPESLTLKEGAQVILTKNMDKYHVNGSRGVVVGFKVFSKLHIEEWQKPRFSRFSSGWIYDIEIPKVKFFDGSESYIPPVVFTTNGPKINGSETQIWRMGFPLKLAWAITVHKSQGMTLDYCKVDLSQIFTPGLAYVALSRVKNAKNLEIVNINWKKIDYVNEDAKKFYKNLQNSNHDPVSSPLGKRSSIGSSSEMGVVPIFSTPTTKKVKTDSDSSMDLSFTPPQPRTSPSSSSMSQGSQQSQQVQCTTNVIWSWQNGASWKLYDRISQQIEQGYSEWNNENQPESKRFYSVSDTHYIDFKLMKQINKSESWRCRKVKREEQFITRLTKQM